MRLSEFEIESIKNVAGHHFGADVQVFLFGSRTNNLERGGDIDLFIRNPNNPLTETNLSQVTPIELALFDQLIYRFSKLQDSMGSRLFKQLLEALEEDISGLPFIDILYKLEKLNLISNTKDWIVLRQIRNTVSHECPFFKEVQMEELNLLPEEVVKLAVIWLKLKEYTLNRLEL